MEAEDVVVLLAANPAIAYREFMYRPGGRLARLIADRFEVLATPGSPMPSVQQGDVLIQVRLGQGGQGRCVQFAGDRTGRAGFRRVLPFGSLVLRPRRPADLSEPGPAEPVAASFVAAPPAFTTPGGDAIVEEFAGAQEIRPPASDGSMSEDNDAVRTNAILISGGPGLCDDRDIEHDRSWANYVTPPLLLTDTPKKHASFVSGATEVWWLIYRPAYLARWSDDAAASRQSTVDVRSEGFASYTDLLEDRARKRGWRLAWFDNANDLWARLETFRDPIDRAWYWGHGRDDLWLSLAHSRASVPVRPADSAVVTVASIAGHGRLGRRFKRRAEHHFVGCNTSAFAQEWSRVLKVTAVGVHGVVDFAAIHKSGGDPALVRGARWRRFAAPVAHPVP
jgi:hypothetical protein